MFFLDNSEHPTCRATNIKLRDTCTSSLQCSKLEAKCRSTSRISEDGRPEKRCLCFKNMREDHSTGKCVDIKDHKLIRFDLLHRPKTWQELNPGRPKRPSSKIAISVGSNDDKLKVNICFYAVDDISYYYMNVVSISS